MLRCYASKSLLYNLVSFIFQRQAKCFRICTYFPKLLADVVDGRSQAMWEVRVALLNPPRYLRTPSGEFRKATCSSCEALEQLICSSHTTLEKKPNPKARGFQEI